MNGILLFVFGAAFGSFLNVLAVRYNPDRLLLVGEVVGGRSRCSYCRKTLRWFELIPLVSFALQRGRCRHCGKRISFQYPLVEILSGLIFVLVPIRLNFYHLPPTTYHLLTAFWLLVFLTLLLISLVDFRLSLIPDEANLFLAALGAIIIILSAVSFGPAHGSLLDGYAAFFGLRQNIWLNHFAAAVFAAAFFLALILLTKGKGMGAGDLKLAAAMGLVFGWPDVMLMVFASFVVGAIVGASLVIAKKKKLKSALPFGPFLALASFLFFLFGGQLIQLYLGSLGLL
jgi:prepilin signal peptidase PulO-like enzyme (type II secretory pathway)